MALLRALLVCIFIIGAGPACADLSQEQRDSVVAVYDGRKRIATAFAVAPDVLISAAHVVDGLRSPRVHYRGAAHQYRVIGYYGNKDLAVLYAPTLNASAVLALGRSVTAGRPVAIYGYPSRAGFSQSNGYVTNTAQYMYSGAASRYMGFATAKVRGGYSGGPVIDRETNHVIGVLTNNNGVTSAVDNDALFTRIDDFSAIRTWLEGRK